MKSGVQITSGQPERAPDGRQIFFPKPRATSSASGKADGN